MKRKLKIQSLGSLHPASVTKASAAKRYGVQTCFSETVEVFTEESSHNSWRLFWRTQSPIVLYELV